MTPENKERLPSAASQVEAHLTVVLKELSAAQLQLGRLGNWTGQLDIAKHLKQMVAQVQQALKSAKELQQ